MPIPIPIPVPILIPTLILILNPDPQNNIVFLARSGSGTTTTTTTPPNHHRNHGSNNYFSLYLSLSNQPAAAQNRPQIILIIAALHTTITFITPSTEIYIPRFSHPKRDPNPKTPSRQNPRSNLNGENSSITEHRLKIIQIENAK